MKSLKIYALSTIVALTLTFIKVAGAQTIIPNGDFELWNTFSNYSDPQLWQTPNPTLMGIPLFGKAVVFKSTDHYTGSYACKLLTQHISFPGAPFNAPGFITLGTLSIDIINQTFSVTGGVPINDRPTHLMGYYKYQPVGGDSCTVGIILYKTTAGVRDTIGLGYFAKKDSVNDWQHFSAWIEYKTSLTPDTMNVIALSSAQMDMHPNTALWVDNLYLDYTTGYNEKDASAGISVYQDKETDRIIVFCDFPREQDVITRLYDMSGRMVRSQGPSRFDKGRMVVPYSGLTQGVYVLCVQHDGKTFSKKFLLGF